ncbi:MAG: prolipoprotein diacylglyceryl transferase [Blastocatellia bacterium]|nr:prolipoprotein diacylglyceryl transferase [Blastocatellia bacterium]
MFPELFKIPGIDFTVNTYGALLALAFLAGLFVMARQAEADKLDKNRMYDLGLWVLVASLIGSKLLMIVTDWNEYQGDWRQFFSLDFLRSGGVFYGGFIGAVIASVIMMRIYKLPWWRTADAFAPGIAIGQAIGRLGCFSAGCCWGKPTTAFCGVHFSDKGHEITNVPTIVAHLPAAIQQQWAEKLGGLTAPIHLHPVQLYEVGATLVIFAILLVMARKRRFHGQIVLAYALLYAVARFTIEFWRDDPRGALLGLSTSQLIALLIFIGGVIALTYRSRAARNSAQT